MDINEEAYAIQEEVVEFRRALHRCPEIAFHETMTMEYIREHLEEWEISYKIFDPSGIIAVVGNGKKETIALRADMDALEVQEETGLDFASLNHGCMHACGHDGHTAILLATAKILKKHESELDRRVYLVFQPAEETAEGARFMLKTGVLDSVKRIYGVHIFNGIPSGKISLEAGPRMAATNWLAVHLYGRSGHAGKPHEGIDTAVAVSSMVMNFQSIISRNLNPLDPAVLTIGKVEAGTARNVIAGEAKIEGTARTFSRQAQEMIESRVKEIAKAHEQMYGVDVSVDFQQSSHGALINDPGVVEDVMEKAGEVFDPSEFTHVEAMMLGEDFANYLELYRKYKKDYGLEKIIEGVYTKDTLERLQYAAFDERLSVVNMLIGRLGTCFKDYFLKDRFVTILYEYLKLLRSNLQIDLVVCEARDKYEKLRKEEQMTKQEDHVRKQVLDTLESYEQLTKEEHLDREAAFERVKELFGNEVAGREELTEHTLAALEHAFEFMEDAFGDSQEMVSFVTELNTNYYSIQFLKENDCDKYYQYNKKLLFDKQQEEILSEMDEIEQDLNTAVK